MEDFISVKITKSIRDGKKLMAVFTRKNGKTKTLHFGAEGMSDFTIHKDPIRKERYLNRHKKREDWTRPDTPGSLSRWILWNLETKQSSIKDFKKRFNLK